MGKAASPEEIVSMMVDEFGFHLLPQRDSVGHAGSLAFLRDEVAIGKILIGLEKVCEG